MHMLIDTRNVFPNIHHSGTLFRQRQGIMTCTIQAKAGNAGIQP